MLLGVRILDPASGIEQVADVLIAHGIVAKVGNPGESSSWPEHPDNGATGVHVISQAHHDGELLLTPGLIDAHTHVFGSAGVARVDEIGVEVGVPIIVDAGGPGAETIDDFVASRIAPASTRVKALLSIESGGITDNHPGHNTTRSASRMVTSSIGTFLEAVDRHRSSVVGLKVWATAAAGLQWVEHAVNLSEISSLPMFVHVGELNDPDATGISGDVLDHLQGGDMVTHSFTGLPGSLIDGTGRILPEVIAARDRGVLFDIAPGEVNLSFDRAEAAMSQGWIPDIISSDVHRWARRRNPTMSLPYVMTTFLALGLSLNRIIACASTNPAAALDIETGSPRAGSVATLSLLRRSVGSTIISDGSRSIRGDESLVPVGCFVDGAWIPASPPETSATPLPYGTPVCRTFLAELGEELTHHRHHDSRWRGEELHKLVHRARRKAGLDVAEALQTLHIGLPLEEATLPAGWLLEHLGPEHSMDHLQSLLQEGRPTLLPSR